MKKNLLFFFLVFSNFESKSKFDLLKNNKRLIAEIIGILSFGVLAYAYNVNIKLNNNNLQTLNNKQEEFNQLNKILQNKETEINNINNKQEEFNKSNTTLKNKNNELINNINSINDKYKELNKLNEYLVQSNDNFKKTGLEHIVLNSNLKNKCDKLEKNISLKESEIDKLKKEIENLKENYNELKNETLNIFKEDIKNKENENDLNEFIEYKDFFNNNEQNNNKEIEQINTINKLKDKEIEQINTINKLKNEIEKLKFQIIKFNDQEYKINKINKLKENIENINKKNKIAYFLKNNINFFKKKLKEENLSNYDFIEKYKNILNDNYKLYNAEKISNPFDLGNNYMFLLNSKLNVDSIHYIEKNKYLAYDTLYDFIDKRLLSYKENENDNITFENYVKIFELDFNEIYKELEIDKIYKIDIKFYKNLFLAFLNEIINIKNKKIFDWNYFINSFFENDDNKIKNYENEIKILQNEYDPKNNLLNEDDLK